MFDQAAKYMDHYEQGLYNHILASVAENDPGNTHHLLQGRRQHSLQAVL
jgi:DUF1680 family protein